MSQSTPAPSPQEIQATLAQALTLHQHGDVAAAEHLYRQILDRVPEQPDALHYLGLAAHQAGFPDDALRLMHRSLTLKPENAQFHNNLGAVLRQLARPEEAAAQHRHAVELDPEHADAWLSLGLALKELAAVTEAIAAFERALAIRSDFFVAHTELANLLREEGALEAAADRYRAALAVAPENPRAHNNLGIALRDLDESDGAEACFMQALTLDPNSAEALHNLGTLRADQGRFDEARTLYARAIEAQPRMTEAYVSHAAITRLEADAPELRELHKIALNLEAKPSARGASVHYALGKAHDDLGEHDRAFGHYLEGAHHKRATLRYDAAAQRRFFADMAAVFSADFVNRHAGAGVDTNQPVFIVGMPRSGTTLVEQILASHPQVHGAGELRLLRNAVQERLPSGAGEAEIPAAIAHMQAEDFAAIGDSYATELARRAPGATRITDKMPPNLMLVGLIHLALPEARIIHCQRDPLDTCVSCFSKLFGHGHHFSYDLAELGEFHHLYQVLMRHWERVLPSGRMLKVRYEDVVADTETQARRLIAHCGLEWDDSCLRFHENERPVKTASLYQVRQPIYAGSVGRWRRYEQHLGPLLQILGPMQD